MGFPQTWKPHAGAMLDWDRRGPESALGGELFLGMYRDLGNPLFGALAWVAEGYANSADGRKPDGGARLMAASRFFAMQLGADYSLRADEVDFVLSFTPSIRRGGILGRGEHLRIDLVPGTRSLPQARNELATRPAPAREDASAHGSTWRYPRSRSGASRRINRHRPCSSHWPGSIMPPSGSTATRPHSSISKGAPMTRTSPSSWRRSTRSRPTST